MFSWLKVVLCIAISAESYADGLSNTKGYETLWFQNIEASVCAIKLARRKKKKKKKEIEYC